MYSTVCSDDWATFNDKNVKNGAKTIPVEVANHILQDTARRGYPVKWSSSITPSYRPPYT